MTERKPTPELAKALAAFQAELPRIPKSARADIDTRTGGGYGFDYAPIDDVNGTVLPLLGKHGLAFTAWPCLNDAGKLVLEYGLLHTSGEEIWREFPLPAQANAQQIGSAITYARRYTLMPVSGAAPGGEDDGGKAASTAAPAAANGEPAADAPPRSRLNHIAAHFNRLQVTDRGIRLGYVAALTGHAVTTSSELTDDEQEKLLDILSKCRNRDALDQRAKQEEDA